MNIRQGRVICTGKGGTQVPHKRRVFGAYQAGSKWFMIYQKNGALFRDGKRAMWTYPPMPFVQFRCPTCKRDMRFRSEDLLAFLLETPEADSSSQNRRTVIGTVNCDLSVLAAKVGSA